MCCVCVCVCVCACVRACLCFVKMSHSGQEIVARQEESGRSGYCNRESRHIRGGVTSLSMTRHSGGGRSMSMSFSHHTLSSITLPIARGDRRPIACPRCAFVRCCIRSHSRPRPYRHTDNPTYKHPGCWCCLQASFTRLVHTPRSHASFTRLVLVLPLHCRRCSGCFAVLFHS